MPSIFSHWTLEQIVRKLSGMIVIRCTQKLLKLSKIMPHQEVPVSMAPLGEWYANTISLTYPGKMAVIYTHNPSRLTVITRGRSIKTTEKEFRMRLINLLDRLGVDERLIARQKTYNKVLHLTRTDSRSMLGSMNEISYFIQHTAAMAGSVERLDVTKLEDKL